MEPLKSGDKVPEFKLLNDQGELVKINADSGVPMVIYFYPKDDTPGCIKEACAFRDHYEQFSDAGVQVFGISADDVESHKNFKEKYRLPFTLLSDTENEVRKLFGVPKTFLLFPGRVTYVIDKNGYVTYVFNSQFKAETHIQKALAHITTK